MQEFSVDLVTGPDDVDEESLIVHRSIPDPFGVAKYRNEIQGFRTRKSGSPEVRKPEERVEIELQLVAVDRLLGQRRRNLSGALVGFLKR